MFAQDSTVFSSSFVNYYITARWNFVLRFSIWVFNIDSMVLDIGTFLGLYLGYVNFKTYFDGTIGTFLGLYLGYIINLHRCFQIKFV